MTECLSNLMLGTNLPEGVHWWGLTEFEDARQRQLTAVKICRNQGLEGIFLCEHPRTLSFGKRASVSESGLTLSEWRARGVTVAQTDRGGGVTLHLPGQLLIYPVLSLRRRSWGPRKFVCELSSALIEALSDFKVSAHYDPKRVGVWIFRGRDSRKVASIGLRIVDGISCHGMALNVTCDLEPFTWFQPCGIAQSGMSNLLEELPLGYSHCVQAIIRQLSLRLLA